MSRPSDSYDKTWIDRPSSSDRNSVTIAGQPIPLLIPKHSFDGSSSFRESGKDDHKTFVSGSVTNPLLDAENKIDADHDNANEENHLHIHNSRPLTIFLLINTMIGKSNIHISQLFLLPINSSTT